MEDSFSKFCERKINELNSQAQSKKNSMPSEENIQELLGKYNTYTKEDLMKEFLNMSAQKKERGELSRNSIENMQDAIFPYLDEEQKKIFNNLMNMVK